MEKQTRTKDFWIYRRVMAFGSFAALIYTMFMALHSDEPLHNVEIITGLIWAFTGLAFSWSGGASLVDAMSKKFKRTP